MQLSIDIFEDNAAKPVLTHTFYGKNAQEIKDIVAAHQQTDSFFKAALTTGKFRGMKLTTRSRWKP